MSPLRSALSRLSAPRSDRGLQFEPEAFEHVAAGDGVALVRLAGRWHASPERLVPDVRLVMVIGGVPVAIPKVPDPTQSQAVAAPMGSAWRGAFRVSAEVIDQPGIDFRLEADEMALELPHPSEMGRPVSVPVATPAAPEEQAPEPAPRPAAARVVASAPDAVLPPSSANQSALNHVRELEARLVERAELVDQTEQRATRAEVEYIQARAELEQAWAQAVELRSVAETVEDRARRAEAEHRELEARVAEAERESATARERLVAEETSRQQAEAGQQAESDRRLRLQAELDTLAATERELRAELTQARARLERADAAPLVVGPTHDDDRPEQLQAELETRTAVEAELRAKLTSTLDDLEDARNTAAHERETLSAERQALEAELLRINQADAEREALQAEVEALRHQVEHGGTAGGDRVGPLEEELERRISAEHELRAQLETQEAELGAARAAADSRARELQDAERRIAQAAIKSRAVAAAAAPGEAAPQFDHEVMGRIAAAKEAAALVGE